MVGGLRSGRERPKANAAGSSVGKELPASSEAVAPIARRQQPTRSRHGPAAGLVAVCLYLWATEPVFMTWPNWQNILRTQSVVAIIAIGMTFVVLTAGIDLSVASIAASSGIVLGLLIGDGWSWPQAVLASVGVGVAMGLANGLLIGVLRIPFFVVTLGTLSIYASIALLLSKTGETRSLLGYTTFDSVTKLTNGLVWKLPTIFLIAAGMYIVASAVLRYTRFGRAVYAVGRTAKPASLTGIRVQLVQVAVYTISGFFAALGTIVLAGHLTATAPQAEPNLMLTVVAAVLIGGVAFTGGEGNLLGTGRRALPRGDSGRVAASERRLVLAGPGQRGRPLAAVGIGVIREHRVEIRALCDGAPASCRGLARFRRGLTGLVNCGFDCPAARRVGCVAAGCILCVRSGTLRPTNPEGVLGDSVEASCSCGRSGHDRGDRRFRRLRRADRADRSSSRSPSHDRLREPACLGGGPAGRRLG